MAETGNTMIRVRQMTSASGNNIANQFILNDGNVEYFQSYRSIIVKREGGKITLDNDTWDYSATTGKYRNQFLGEGIKDTRRKIKSGEYALDDLNG